MKSDKCHYCIGDSQHNAALIEALNVLLYLDDDKLTFEGYGQDGYTTDDYAKINYCPMCGRKLEEAE